LVFGGAQVFDGGDFVACGGEEKERPLYQLALVCVSVLFRKSMKGWLCFCIPRRSSSRSLRGLL
jgi:hypothetical protein